MRFSSTMIILMGLVPIVAGLARLFQIAGLPLPLPDMERLLSSRTDILVVHIASGVLFWTLGAVQFSTRLRITYPSLHRRLGRILFALALILGTTTIWLTLFFPQAPYNGAVVKAVRLVIAPSFIAMVLLSYLAVRRKDFVTHQIWMVRAMALSLGTGTQVYFFILWMSVSDIDTDLTRGAIFAFASILNLVIANRLLRPLHRSAQKFA